MRAASLADFTYVEKMQFMPEASRATPHEVGVARPILRSVHAALRRGTGTRLRTRARTISASTDHGPGPTIKRNSTLMSWAYSERTSCSTAQMPI
jgi:hypothetical protein